jgi:aminopeptidase N
LTAATDFRTGSRKVGNTTVRVWYRPGFPASAALDAAADALARMNALLATPYPYAQFNVVQSAGGYGMESPGLIWIPTGVGSSNLRYLAYHETAHQWFYGLVGADQAREPFTDEAAADFVARYALGARRASRCSTARLDLTIYQYSSSCYYEVVYIQGGNFLNDLRVRVGSTAFWRGMRAYVANNQFRIAPTKGLLDTLDAHTTLNLVSRYESRFPRLY